MAAARGAGRPVARGSAPAVRDRGPDLVLSPLPDDRAHGRPDRGLPRPDLLAARLRRADRRGEGPLRRRRRGRARGGLVPRALRHRARGGGRRAAAGVRRRGCGGRGRARRRAPACRGQAGERAAPERPVRGRRRALPPPPPRAGRRPRRRRDRRDAEGVRAEGHGRRGLPDRPEVGDRRGPGADAALHGLQRRRVRARHVQGPPDHGRAAAPRARGDAARDARDRLRGGLGLHPPRVRPRGGGPARRDRGAALGGPGRRRRARLRPSAAARDLHVARRLHPRRGVGAARVHGGPPRRAAQQAAVPRRFSACGASRR